MKKVFLTIIMICVVFLAINKTEKPLVFQNYGDIEGFKEKSIENEKIVLFDNSGTTYSRYYTYYFTGDNYILYSNYYLIDKDQYMEMYKNNVEKIVDYNYDNLMIKTIEEIGESNYYTILNSYQELNDKNLYIVY